MQRIVKVYRIVY